MQVLGIETSCDDTAAGVVEDGTRVRASVVSTQLDLHGPFGGVVPELASRRHLETVIPTVEAALDAAGVTWSDLDGVAVTRGPGLIGSLLVGLCTAKAFAWAHGLPLLGVNHLEAHIQSVFLEYPDLQFPMLSLVVSGGHTSLYLLPHEGSYEMLASTRDDAAGEAFDKVAKYMGFGYPGGPVVDRLAATGDDGAFAFSRPKMSDGSLDFSFSGLKTAALYTMQREGLEPVAGLVRDLPSDAAREDGAPQVIRDLFASFQRAVVEFLLHRTIKAVESTGVGLVTLTGGVACNSRLRTDLAAAGARHGFTAVWPRPAWCADNGAMVAAAGSMLLRRGRISGLDLDAIPDLMVGEEA